MGLNIKAVQGMKMKEKASLSISGGHLLRLRFVEDSKKESTIS